MTAPVGKATGTYTPPRNKACVIASLTPETIDLYPPRSSGSYRVPIDLVPPDLRHPNAEFWLESDSDGVLYLFRHEHDVTPERSARWREH